MQELNISENSFRRYRKELEDKGYITVEFRNIKGTNRNVYKINNSVEQKKEPQNLTPTKFGTLPKSTPSKFGTQIIKDSKECLALIKITKSPYPTNSSSFSRLCLALIKITKSPYRKKIT